MPVFIYELNALDRMAAVEGGAWRVTQDRDQKSPYGFFAYLEAWGRKLDAGADAADDALMEFLAAPGDGAIYGNGGYARYAVSNAGEIVLLAWSTLPEKKEIARAQGFTVR